MASSEYSSSYGLVLIALSRHRRSRRDGIVTPAYRSGVTIRHNALSDLGGL